MNEDNIISRTQSQSILTVKPNVDELIPAHKRVIRELSGKRMQNK